MARSNFESQLNESIALAQTVIQLDKSLLSLTSWELKHTIVKTKAATIKRLLEVHEQIEVLFDKFSEQFARELQSIPDGDTDA